MQRKRRKDYDENVKKKKTEMKKCKENGALIKD